VKVEFISDLAEKKLEKPMEINKCKKFKAQSFETPPYRPKTRSTNKLRLNAKAIFYPSLKIDKVIVDDEAEAEEKFVEITKEEGVVVNTLAGMAEMTEVYKEEDDPKGLETTTKDIAKEKSPKVPKKVSKRKKSKLFIDLNRLAPEEIPQ